MARSHIAFAQSVVFVSQQATGLHSGTSWADAFVDLQSALQSVAPPATIYVARGTYKPGASRGSTFELRSGVQILGGFSGQEEPGTLDLRFRDFAINATLLQGDIGVDTNAAHVFHVVTAQDVDEAAVLDGFTITGGHADGISASKQDVGGGLLILNGSPSIRQCRFIANRAGSQGGAVHVFGGAPSFLNCIFLGNVTTVTQGSANVGGAVYLDASAGESAGATFTNCLFSGNSAGVGAGGTGGAIYAASGIAPALINCTLVNNAADSQAGGIFGTANITNSILWANRDAGPTDQSAQFTGAGFVVNYTCVQGWTGNLGGSGNIADDPLFANAVGDDGAAGTADDNARLMAGSPAIDAGDNTAVTAATDLDGSPRIINGLVDMGAYERCNGDVACEDGNPCTNDRCDNEAGRCFFDPVVCTDNVYCNGLEQCIAGACEAGAAPCPALHCDETQKQCVECLDDVECDDGVFCNGPERCLAGVCSAGTAIQCDDGIDCTDDLCDEATAACTASADDSLCDNGLFCDGLETCDLLLGCQTGTSADCDDGVDCTADSCNNASGTCVHAPDDTLCSDGLFCNGAETCDSIAGCSSALPPCPSPLGCDESLGACTGCTADGECADDDPCTLDRCVEAKCLNDRDPNCCATSAECDDGNPCTDDTCLVNECQIVDNNTLCDDGNVCTEADRCNAGACAGTPIPNCGGQPSPPPSPPPPPPPPDEDDDGVTNDFDNCPQTGAGEAVDSQGCSCRQLDSDKDGVSDCDDACPDDPSKSQPGQCGCGEMETDDDGDTVPNCVDQCSADAGKTLSGACGCGVSDDDGDSDSIPDCLDKCPTDSTKTAPGLCGCGVRESDADGDADAVPDCIDQCPDIAGVVLNGGCPAIIDNGVPQPLPGLGVGQIPPLCGGCGAFGLWGWTVLAAGLISMRRRRCFRRHG